MTAVKRARKYSETSKVINFRITPGTKALLEQSARAHGRTVSSECELQLQRALSDWGNSQTNAIMTLIGHVIDGLVGIRDISELGKKQPKRHTVKWLSDPYHYAQAEQVVIAALRMFRPRGTPPGIDPRQGNFALNATVHEMQTADETVPFEQQKPHQRRMNRLRNDLGVLADRPAPFGLNGAEEREKQKLIKPFQDELIRLSRKRTPMPAEKKRLTELRLKVREITG